MKLRTAAGLALALAVLPSLLAPARARGGDPQPAAAPAGAPLGVAPGVVDVPTARRLVAAGVKVVDVRTPAEFAAGHVPGALNIPHDQMEARHGEIGPPSTPVVVYCRTGHRSGMARRTLVAKGFGLVYDFQRWDAWAASEPRK